MKNTRKGGIRGRGRVGGGGGGGVKWYRRELDGYTIAVDYCCSGKHPVGYF